MKKPINRITNFDNKPFEEPTYVSFGSLIKEVNERTKTENEDVLLSSAIDGMYLNSELFSHQRGKSNIGYRKVKKNMLILSAQNLHLGNANVNFRFEHGIVSPAYKVYEIIGCMPEYLAHWLKSEQSKKFFFDATTIGASVCRRNVDWKKLYSQAFYLPCIEEQKMVSDCLSSVDAVIADYEAQVENMQNQKKGVMQKLFSQEVRFKADDGSEYPAWKEQRLGEHGSFVRGLSYTSDECIDDSAGTLVIRSNNIIQDGNVDCVNGLQFVSKDCSDEQKLRKGDVAICLANGSPNLVGKTAFYDGMFDGKATVGAFCGIYRSNSPIIKFLFQTDNCKKQIQRIKQGGNGSIANLYGSDILSLKFEIPCLEEQQKIADCLTAFDDAIEDLQKTVEHWKNIKKGLLQQLFA